MWGDEARGDVECAAVNRAVAGDLWGWRRRGSWPAAPASAADRVIVGDPTATNVSAHNGQPVWSRLARDGRAKLVGQIRGKARDLPVRSKTGGVFDPDLGTNPNGQAVIVYTRCAGVSGRNCDVYEFNRATRRERRSPARPATPARSSRRRSGSARSSSGARARPSATASTCCAGATCESSTPVVPAQTDIRGSGVAYLYIPPNDVERTFIRVRSLYRGKSRILVTGFAAEGESYRVTNPTMFGRYTLLAPAGPRAQRVLRRPRAVGAAARRCSSATGSSPARRLAGASPRTGVSLHQRPGPVRGDRPGAHLRRP